MILRLVEKEQLAADTYVFHFAPEPMIDWQAGQSIRLTLPAGWDTEERRFTITSAPREQRVSITTRISTSDFKQALHLLPIGGEVLGTAVSGKFLWQQNKQPPILAAIGIGVTPFISMLRDRIGKDAPVDARMLYAYSPERGVYIGELEQIAIEHPMFSLQLFPDKKLGAEAVFDLYAPATPILIAGPSRAATQLRDDLFALGVAETDIYSDWFTGRAHWESA